MNVRLVKRTNNIGKMKELIKKIDAPKTTLSVGWLKGFHYDNEENTAVAQVAMQNEYGVPAKHIPPRPFMRPTSAEHLKEWQKLFAQFIKKQPISDVFEKLGLVVSGQIKAKIASIWEPPLSPVTVQMRMQRYRSKNPPQQGIYKPLVDTGVMLASVSYEINEGGNADGQ